MVCLLLLPIQLEAAEAPASDTPMQENSSDSLWLPLSQDDKLSGSLLKANQHALQRDGCARIVESKLADQFDSTNPKFIVTCQHDRGGTFNLVYFQTDIDNGFSEIKQAARSAISQQQFEALREDCRLALLQKYGAGIPQLENTISSANRRGEGHYSLFFDYTEGVGEHALNFTITCIQFPERTMKVAIFPR